MNRPPLPFFFVRAAASVALPYLLEFTASLPTSKPNRKLPMKTRNWSLWCKENIFTERQWSNDWPRNTATPYPPSPGKVLQPKSEGGNSWWERAATWPGAGASREKKQDNLEELWERRVAKSSPKMFIWLFKKFPAIRGTPSDFE